MVSEQLSLGGECSRPSDLAPAIPTTPNLLRLQGKNVVNSALVSDNVTQERASWVAQQQWSYGAQRLRY